MTGVDFTTKLNKDVLHTVYTDFQVPELRSLRLLNASSRDIASNYLFRTLVIRPRKSILANVINISQHTIFAKSVRTLIWEAGHYFDPLSDFEDAGSWDERGRRADMCQGDDRMQKMRDEAERWAEEEKEALSEESLADLAAALARFTGLKTLELCSWARRFEMLRALVEKDKGALDPEDNQIGRLPLFFNRSTEYTRQTDALCFILRALAAANRSLGSLRLSAVLDERVNSVIFQRERGGEFDPLSLHMLVCWDRLPETFFTELTAPLQRLTRLRLGLSGDGETFVAAVWEGKVASLLSHLPKLEDLTISTEGLVQGRLDDDLDTVMHFRRLARIPMEKFIGADDVFPRLRRLEIRFFWLDASELCNLLARHEATIEEFLVYMVMLGGTHDTEDPGPGKPNSLVLRKPREERRSFSPNDESTSVTSQQDADADRDGEDGKRTMPTPTLPEWDQVVLACQKLPRLRGVDFQAPMEFERRGEGAIELRDLELRAMNGRVNCLDRLQWTGITRNTGRFAAK